MMLLFEINLMCRTGMVQLIYTPTIPNDLGWCVKSLSDGYLLLGYGNDKSSRNKINLFQF